jgi:hypothetical protein
MVQQNNAGKKKIDWWIYPIPFFFLILVAAYLYVQSRPGIMGVGVYYLTPFFCTVVAVVFIIIAVIRSFMRKPFFTPWRIGGFIALIALACSGGIFGKYPSSFDSKPSKVAFRLPLDSTLTVCWGGGTEKTNYHVVAPDQCWAYDLLMMKNDKSYSGDSSKLTSYFIYGQTVLAPANGVVINTADTFPDMPVGVLGGGGIQNPTGNHLVIQVAPKEYLFLCHLQPHSLKVKKGDTVQQGQELGLVGNSGNTSEPHIHIHLQSTTMLAFGEGIPLEFHHYLSGNKYVDHGIPLGGVSKEGKITGEVVRNVDPR